MIKPPLVNLGKSFVFPEKQKLCGLFTLVTLNGPAPLSEVIPPTSSNLKESPRDKSWGWFSCVEISGFSSLLSICETRDILTACPSASLMV